MLSGGSYITGGTAIPLYDGVDLVDFWEGRVVLVTTNYRLNVFGFLGSTNNDS
jgi:carboxylesterase type B